MIDGGRKMRVCAEPAWHRTAAAIANMMIAVALTSPLTARADERTEARQHFRRGMQLIEAGAHGAGIAELEEAYRTVPHPHVLYNIARAYTEADDYGAALTYFERYLATGPTDQAEVQAAVVGLRQALDRRQQAAARADRGTAISSPPSVAATEAELAEIEGAAADLEGLGRLIDSPVLLARSARLRQTAAVLGGARHDLGQTVAVAAAAHDVAETATDDDEDLYAEEVVSASGFAQSPRDAPNSTTIVTAQDIRLSGLTSIGELLRRVAGTEVMTLTPADTQVGLRGFNQRLSNRLLVLIDGRSVYLDALGTTFYSIQAYGPEDIERIEIIRGPASALYGADAFSGVVNIITKAPGEDRTEATIGTGTGGWAHAHVSASGGTGRSAYRIGAGYDQAHQFTVPTAGNRLDVVAASDNPFGLMRAYSNGALRYRLSRRATAMVQAGINENRQTFQGSGPFGEFQSVGPTGHLMAEVDAGIVDVRVFWNHVDGRTASIFRPVGGERMSSQFVANTLDAQTQLSAEETLVVPHNVTLGAGYRLKTIGWDFLDDAHDESHFAFFFQDALTVLPKLSLVLSTRLDIHPLLDTPVFSPRGSIIVRPTAGSTVRSTVGTAFRTPTFLESYLALPNPTPIAAVGVDGLGAEVGGPALAPESILAAEIGYENGDAEAFEVEVTGYYNRVRDLIQVAGLGTYRLADYSGPGAIATYEGATAAFPFAKIGFANESIIYDVLGAELGVHLFPLEGIDLHANYAAHHSFATNRPAERPDDQRTSTHKLNLGLQFRSEAGIDVSVDLHWVSPQVWVEPSFGADGVVAFADYDLPAYYLLNARLSYRLLADQMELGLVGYNLTDHRHREHPFGQRLGARMLATLAYRF